MPIAKVVATQNREAADQRKVLIARFEEISNEFPGLFASICELADVIIGLPQEPLGDLPEAAALTELILSGTSDFLPSLVPFLNCEALFERLIDFSRQFGIPSAISCLSAFSHFAEFDVLLSKSGFHILALESLVHQADFRLLLALSSMVARTRLVHEAVLDDNCGLSQSAFFPFIYSLLSNSNEEVLLCDLCSLLDSLTKFPLLNSEVSELVSCFQVVIDRQFLGALPQIAMATVALLKRNSPIPTEVASLVQTLVFLLEAVGSAAPFIVMAIGLSVAKLVALDMDWTKVSSLCASQSPEIVSAAGWCLATVAPIVDLGVVNFAQCLIDLHSCFQEASHESKIDLAFPIVTIARLLDTSTVLEFCVNGFVDTLAVLLSTKSVTVLESVLLLIVDLAECGSDFLNLALEGGILDALVGLTEADDFNELAPSRIPDLVWFLLNLFDP